MISSQIQMKNRENQMIDQRTCPVPHSAANSDIGTPLMLVACDDDPG